MGRRQGARRPARFFIPPDRSAGILSNSCSRPTSASFRVARSRMSASDQSVWRRIGNATLSRPTSNRRAPRSGTEPHVLARGRQLTARQRRDVTILDEDWPLSGVPVRRCAVRSRSCRCRSGPAGRRRAPPAPRTKGRRGSSASRRSWRRNRSARRSSRHLRVEEEDRLHEMTSLTMTSVDDMTTLRVDASPTPSVPGWS